MIKINLLPRTINQKAVLRNTAVIFAVLLAFVISAGVAYSMKLRGQVQQMETMAADAEAWETRVKGIQTETENLLSSIKPIQDKLDFINNVLDYNLKYPALYEEVAKWTYQKVVLVGMGCDGTQVTLQARVKSLDDLGRYLLNMYQATGLFTEVAITSIPSFGASQSAGQFSGMPTMPGMPGRPGMPGMAGLGGGEIGGSQAPLAGIEAISTSVQRMPLESGWIEFTVTCKLKTPIVAPTFAGAGGGAADAQSAPGMPGPAMPGMPGPGMPEPGMPMPGAEGTGQASPI